MGNGRKWVWECVHMLFSRVLRRENLPGTSIPTRSPGGRGGRSPPATTTMGKPTAAAKKLKKIKNFETPRNGLKRWVMVGKGRGSAFKCCFRAFCAWKTYQEHPFLHALRGGLGGRRRVPAAKNLEKIENSQNFSNARKRRGVGRNGD